MRNQFPFLGIASPLRQNLSRTIITQHPQPSKEEILLIWQSCWDLPEREYQYFVQDSGKRWSKHLTPDDLPFLEALIQQKSWWDTVDFLAPKFVGPILYSYPEVCDQWLDRWVEQDNIWLQRTVLLHQLTYKTATNWDRLASDVKKLTKNQDFFVQKATGWALRQYAKVAPEMVYRFIDQHRSVLSPLAQKEGEKHRKK